MPQWSGEMLWVTAVNQWRQVTAEMEARFPTILWSVGQSNKTFRQGSGPPHDCIFEKRAVLPPSELLAVTMVIRGFLMTFRSRFKQKLQRRMQGNYFRARWLHVEHLKLYFHIRRHPSYNASPNGSAYVGPTGVRVRGPSASRDKKATRWSCMFPHVLLFLFLYSCQEMKETRQRTKDNWSESENTFIVTE